jgi:hypothetical protein
LDFRKDNTATEKKKKRRELTLYWIVEHISNLDIRILGVPTARRVASISNPRQLA